ncbi:hypothetical protein [Galbibacter mesophilus]|uniref:hypothetical protein n=1 Tax=Galbibacter mesophilus TaxID=379069 RepID=UPI0019200D92|nr:hypothetical protein [Galbibacter mesophilus]MCM5662077.1 hypothetical protein [Galbibacter mesophilus]
MKKDIEIPIANDVYVAAVNEWDEKHLAKTWYVYLINNRDEAIEATILVSKGYGEGMLTSTMRHGLGTLEAKSYRKVEIIQEDVFKLTNEYFITFFAENKLFERKFLFDPHQISENNATTIPLMEVEGVLAK